MNRLKNLILYLIVILLCGCSLSDTGKGEVVTFEELEAACEIYNLTQSSYDYNVNIYFRLQPIVFDTEPLDVDRLEKIINNRYSKGGYYYEVQTPIYATLEDSVVSYLNYFNNYYRPGEITCLVFPEGITLTEERPSGGRIQGAADGIPTIDRPNRARPTFFMRREKIYTEITNHELGHINGLFHTFYGNDQRNKGLNCDTGDKISTTITPHPQAGVFMESCELFLPEGFEDYYTKEEKRNIIENTESYSPEYCMKGFKKEQFERMRKILEVNGRLEDCIIRTELKPSPRPPSLVK